MVINKETGAVYLSDVAFMTLPPVELPLFRGHVTRACASPSLNEAHGDRPGSDITSPAQIILSEKISHNSPTKLQFETLFSSRASFSNSFIKAYIGKSCLSNLEPIPDV